MENNKDKRPSILVEETETGSNLSQETPKSKAEKLKKPLIFSLMGIVFFACMYLLFKPSGNSKKLQDAGLNEAVPQATESVMQADKQKAYEQAFFEQKEQEKKNALISLSDYWNDDPRKQQDSLAERSGEEGWGEVSGIRKNGGNSALNSYRDAQNALGAFYQDNDYGTAELRKEINDLKERLAEKETNPTGNMIDNQLALMEKSYQMAAKFFPPANNGNAGSNSQQDSDSLKGSVVQKQGLSPLTPAARTAVSTLYREPIGGEFATILSNTGHRGFLTPGLPKQETQPKNSIRAFVLETQTVINESSVRIRLEEAARIKSTRIQEGTVVTAFASFNGGRLQLRIGSIEQNGNVIPVDIIVYDLDGQPGINVPFSAEANAVTQIASNMSQAAGTSVMMTRSAGQQIAGDLSRGLIQGVSGYISKKINTPKVTLKAGYHLLLVSKK